MTSLINRFEFFILFKQRRRKEDSRRCDICDVHIPRTSFAKYLRIKKHLENIKRCNMLKTKKLFQERIENKPEKIYNLELYGK